MKSIVRQIGIFVMTLFLMSEVVAKEVSDYQVWTPININYKVNDKVRAFLELQPRVGNDGSHLKTGIIRPAIGYAITPEITLWAGYLMQASDNRYGNPDNYDIENRIWQGLTYKTTFNKQFIFEVRNRLEERFLDHNPNEQTRWRTRFRGEYLIDQTPLSVIASEEIFVNLHNNGYNKSIQEGFDQNRSYIGVGYRFAPEFQVETGYLKQYVGGYAGKANQNNDVWMTNFNVNF